MGIVYLWAKAIWMKYYLIAGEASGDLHGANLINELAQADTTAEVRAWGGDRMHAQGATIVKHYRELAFMGFWEVAKNIRTILGNLKKCKEDILAFKPDALILIDYPGFNLRIATWAKQVVCSHSQYQQRVKKYSSYSNKNCRFLWYKIKKYLRKQIRHVLFWM